MQRWPLGVDAFDWNSCVESMPGVCVVHVLNALVFAVARETDFFVEHSGWFHDESNPSGTRTPFESKWKMCTLGRMQTENELEKSIRFCEWFHLKHFECVTMAKKFGYIVVRTERRHSTHESCTYAPLRQSKCSRSIFFQRANNGFNSNLTIFFSVFGSIFGGHM